MRPEPGPQWAINPQFPDMARICAGCHDVEELAEQIFTPMATWLGVDLISLTLIDERSVVTVADGGGCTATDNSDGSHTIVCDDGTTFTVRDGDTSGFAVRYVRF